MAANPKDGVQALREFFREDLTPLEEDSCTVLLTDNCTGAQYCECHIKASKLIAFGTTDVPLDPNQAEYRANRMITDEPAFGEMQRDALNRRSFSNLVTEYTRETIGEPPLKIIGGQHRFEAIRGALEKGVDEYHGVKVYFGLDS